VLNELRLAAEKLEQELVEADESYRVKRSELRRAIEYHERADLDVEQARSGANGARELVDSAGIELHGLQQRASKLDEMVMERARQLPRSVREPPPAWAVWLWLWHALFVTFRRDHWQSYRALLREREAIGARLEASRAARRRVKQSKRGFWPNRTWRHSTMAPNRHAPAPMKSSARCGRRRPSASG
jgi:hypothetical protein